MELVLCLAVLAVVLLAVVHVGLVARDQVLVTHAAREAARAAAVGADAAAAARAGPLDPAALTVVVQHEGDSVRALVTYRCDPGVPIVGGMVRPRTLRAEAVMRLEDVP